MAARSRFYIDHGWRFRMSNANGYEEAQNYKLQLESWMPMQKFPSVIHSELISTGVIPHPYLGQSERLVQWVGHTDWEYSVKFSTPDTISQYQELVFEGLDTVATVKLNDIGILKSDNMFLPARVDVKDKLRRDRRDNELTILFESAERVASAREAEFGVLKPTVMRGTKRVQLRKAQYHWGWDWGPKLLTSGPYLPIYLESYDARVDGIHVGTSLNDTLDSADLSITVDLVGSSGTTHVKVIILDDVGNTVFSDHVKVRGTSTVVSTRITQPRLWWPNGHGAQALYTAKAQLLRENGSAVDTKTTSFGIRKIELIQRPLANAPGKTFMFSVNNHALFAQGGNWIPADMMLPNIPREKYFDWIELAAHNNLNMIRVWGGGIYESEDFLDACDRYGLLVWHDFAFACGHFPVREDFLASVRAEAVVQTKRMRNRACLALLCGGNEDFMLQDMFRPGSYDHHDVKGPFLDKPFEWREIYLGVLPRVVEEVAPGVQYWPSSPWGGETANDLTVGDVHQWDVWHGKQLPYQNYSTLSGRFISEFGMHGFPSMRTVADFITSPEDSHPQSKAIDCHNKGHGAHSRIAKYLAENFRYSTKLEDFVYASQLMQSEAYGYALRGWKRKFGGRGGEECAGAIIWQLNDVYPATSWAYVDYYLRPKPAFYTIRRAFAPISLGIDRTPKTMWVDEDRPGLSAQPPRLAFFAHNTQSTEAHLTLEVQVYDFGKRHYLTLKPEEARRQAVLAAGCNTEVGELLLARVPPAAQLVVCAKLVNSSGRAVARHVNWPEPYRYLTWPSDTKATYKIKPSSREEWGHEVEISANVPVKGYWLEQMSTTGTEPKWEDNMLDLMPGEMIVVGVNGLDGSKLQARFLSDWEATSDNINEGGIISVATASKL